MSDREPVSVVTRLFEAFGRGDVPAILDLLREDVEWIAEGPPELPWAGVYRGRDGCVQFFTRIGQHAEFERFEPREFVAQGEQVVVLGWERGRARSTGRTFENHWAMAFTLRDGEVAAFRLYEDTAAVAAAFQVP